MTFDDGMNPAGGWSPSEAAADYDRLLDAELRAAFLEDMRDDLYVPYTRVRDRQERQAA